MFNFVSKAVFYCSSVVLQVAWSYK